MTYTGTNNNHAKTAAYVLRSASMAEMTKTDGGSRRYSRMLRFKAGVVSGDTNSCRKAYIHNQANE